MTSHGFAKPVIMSGKISEKEITSFAKQILELKPITRTHVAKHIVCGEKVGYDIIIEFDHLRNQDMTPAKLLKELRKIQVDNHRIARSTEFWIIQETYQKKH